MSAPAPGDRISWELISGGAAAAVFDASWDDLTTASPYATAFQTAAWHRAWVEAVATAEGQTPLVIRVLAGRRPAAGLALQVAEHGGGRVISPLTAPWADYHDAVGSPAQPAVWRALADALALVARQYRAELQLTDLVDGGLLDRALPAALPRRQHTAVIGLDLTDREHLRQVHEVSEYARKLRRLSRLAEVSCRHFDRTSEIGARFGRLIELHRQQWAGRADAVAPFEPTVVEGFLAMIRHMAPARQVIFTELRAGDEVIACYFGFRWKDWYGAYRTAFDQRYYRYSPGHLMLRAMMADFARAGIRHFDLTRGKYPYKMAYASQVGHNTSIRCDPADLMARLRQQAEGSSCT